MINDSGRRFGRLVVVEMFISPNKRGKNVTFARCTCDCGNEKVTLARSLRAGNTRSCGCLHKESVTRNGLGCRKDSVLATELKVVLRNYKKNANLRGFEFLISNDKAHKILSSNCNYCGSAPAERYRWTTVGGVNTKVGTGVFMHGMDRVDSSLGYIEDNVVPCCWLCNQSKNDMSLEDFKSLIARQYKNMFNQPHRFYLRPDSQDISYSEAA